MLEAYGTLFDVHSAVGKHRKQLYQFAANKLQVYSHEIVFQSSNSWDATGASAFEFYVAWINRFGQSKERLPGKPGFEIKNLMVLPDLIS